MIVGSILKYFDFDTTVNFNNMFRTNIISINMISVYIQGIIFS